jgi:hypothetical protein
MHSLSATDHQPASPTAPPPTFSISTTAHISTIPTATRAHWMPFIGAMSKNLLTTGT